MSNILSSARSDTVGATSGKGCVRTAWRAGSSRSEAVRQEGMLRGKEVRACVCAWLQPMAVVDS